MKILQVNKFFKPEYGTEKYLFNLFRLLEGKGHEVIHFSMERPGNLPSKQSKYFVSEVDMSKAKTSWSSIKALGRMIYSREARRKFAELLETEKPDLIHVHSIHHQISPSILLEAKKRDIPVVQTLHDYKLIAPSYHFPFRHGKVCLRCSRGNWLHLIKHRAHKDSLVATLGVVIESFIHDVLKIYEKNVDMFIVPSNNMAQNLIDFGIDAEKLAVVPHFIEQKTSRVGKDLGKGVLFVGRLAEERGLDHVIKAASALPNVPFYVAGDGPESEALEAKIKMQNLKNIILLGRLSGDDLQRVYQESRMVFFPTQTMETFGLTILEAMQAGKPVVGSSLGAVTDLIVDGKNGFSYDPDNVSEAIEKIRLVVEDDALCRRLSESAIDSAQAYAPGTHYEKLAEVYSTTLKSKTREKVRAVSGEKRHIAVMGHRGIPGNYGGFETFAEEISTRLYDQGHRVDVYCRTNTGDYRKPKYKGVDLVHLSTISNKYLDTLYHTLKAALHASFIGRPDLIIMVNVGNTIVSWIPRLFGIPVLLNVDGLEWERRKWNKIAKAYLRTSASLARIMPTGIITDAKVIYDYYKEKLHTKSNMIPYGASVKREPAPDVMEKYGLKEDDYYLYVARFEPENNPHKVVEAFENVNTEKNLVMIGDAPYATKFVAKVRDTKDKRIKFLGFVYGSDYKALQQNAYAYVQATEVGGTHPALVEALGFGNCVLVNGTPENMETANGSAIPFWFFRGKNSVEGLTKKIQLTADNPKLVKKHRLLAREHIRKNYRWDKVTDQYIDLINQTLETKAHGALSPTKRAKV